MSSSPYKIGTTPLHAGLQYAVDFMNACMREPIRNRELKSSCLQLYEHVLDPSGINQEQVGHLPQNPRAIPMYAWKIAPFCRAIFDPRFELMRREEDLEHVVRENRITPRLLRGAMDSYLVTQHIAQEILKVSSRVYANDPLYNRKHQNLMVAGVTLVGTGTCIATARYNSLRWVLVGGGMCLLGTVLTIPRKRYIAKLHAASNMDNSQKVQGPST